MHPAEKGKRTSYSKKTADYYYGIESSHSIYAIHEVICINDAKDDYKMDNCNIKQL